MRLVLVLAAVVGALAAEAVTYSRMEVDVSALPQEKAFLRMMVLERAWERTTVSDRAATLKVRFALDAAVSGENAVVSVVNGVATVRAGRFRGLVAGAGKLLRTIRWSGGVFELEDGELRFEPVKKIRRCYCARHFDNWYHRASSDEFARYIDDLALWGMNGFHMQLGYPVVDMAKATAGDVETFNATTRVIADRIAALDCDLTTQGGDNCAPSDMPERFRATAEKPARGAQEFNVCPEKPGAMDYLVSIRKEKLAQAAKYPVTGFVYWPFDEGGCACEKCAPWGGRGFLKLIERYRPINAAVHPKAKHIVSTWIFYDEDWDGFYRYLETKPGWIDALIVDAHGDFPKYPLEHPVPGGIPIITFPEISMWGRFPWGGTGANPLPERFERLYRQAEKVVDGFELYSEGIYEDVNKIVINGLYVDPKASAADVLAEYARWELPGADPADVLELVRLMEEDYETHYGPDDKRGWSYHVVANYVQVAPPVEVDRKAALAAKASALADRIDRAILPRMRRAWRWRILDLRAKIDASVFADRDIRTPLAQEAYGELVTIYHAERQARELVDGTWRGYTCPPFTEHPHALRRRGPVEPWGPKPDAQGRFPRIVTDPDLLTNGLGHVQGVCVSPRAIFFARTHEIVKLDWSGRLVARRAAHNHTGDLCYANGKVYASVADRKDRAGKGRIMIYDEDLNLLTDLPTEKTMDGIAYLDGVLYVGNGVKPYAGMKHPKAPHPVNLLVRYDAETLTRLGPAEDLAFGQDTCYGTQNITTDGENVFAVFYPAKGCDNVVVFDRALRPKTSFRFEGCRAHGLEHVRDDLFMLCVTTGWNGSKKPTGPLQAEFTFWRWNGKGFEDVTAR